MKPGKGSFDSNTVHLRAHGLGPVWTATPYVDGSNPSVHFMSHSFNRRGQRTSNPPIRVRILYETSGYVAKRLCSGLLTRQTQVRPLSCPLRSGDVTAAYRSSKPGVRVRVPFRALISAELLNLCGFCTPDRGVLLFVVMVCGRVNIDVGVAPFEWCWR